MSLRLEPLDRSFVGDNGVSVDDYRLFGRYSRLCRHDLVLDVVQLLLLSVEIIVQPVRPFPDSSNVQPHVI